MKKLYLLNYLLNLLKKAKDVYRKEAGVYTPIYRVARIDQEDSGEYIVTIQLIGKGNTFPARPEKLLADNKIVNLFSPVDARNLTYLGYLGINSPKYKVLAKRFSEKEGQTLFSIHKKGEKKPKVYSAKDISTNEEIIESLAQKEAHMIGLTTATEQKKLEEKQKEKLKAMKKLVSDNLKFCKLSKDEYASIYHRRMLNQKWMPIYDSIDAHISLAIDGVYALKNGNEIIATLSASRFSSIKTAYMGFYIVNDSWKGKGIGKKLWLTVAGLLEKEGYIIEFDSPNKLLPYYLSLGYKIVCSSSVYTLENKQKLTGKANKENITLVNEKNITSILGYDSKILSDNKRQEFLKKWIYKKDTVCMCYIQNEVIIGYGAMSKHLKGDNPFGYILAPIYADSPEVGSEIIKNLCGFAKMNEPIHIDTININKSASILVESLGFEVGTPLHRLSTTGELSNHSKAIIDKVYGLSSHAYSPL